MAKISIPALGESQESSPVPEGEYELRIHSVTEKDSKGGKPMLEILHIVESADYPNAAPIMHWLSLPTEQDNERAANFKTLQIARYCALFGISTDGDEIDTDDFEGKSATVSIEQEQREGFSDPTNVIVIPRLEQQEEAAQPKRRGQAAAPARGRRAAAAEPEEEVEEVTEEEEVVEEEVEETAPAPRRPSR